MDEMNEARFLSQSSSRDLSQFNQVFSQLALQDIEQFQLLYQHWDIQSQINSVQQQIDIVQRQLAENAQESERVHPSALALATLARLQASGVEDIDLLDRMLERGEEWLDRTIQHLEYCEQLDVIRGDYEEWCRHALEDAFAWLDSMQSDTSTTSAIVTDPAPQVLTPDGEAPARQTTEELFLQKLMSEEAGSENAKTENGDEKSEEAASNISDTAPITNSEEQPALEETTLKVATIQTTAEVHDNGETRDALLPSPAPSEVATVTPEPSLETGAPQPVVEQASTVETISPGAEEETAGRRSNFLQRFLTTLWP